MRAGPPLVKVANWLSHLDYDRESVIWRHWLTELSRRHRLIRYDERGCGLSDWDVPEFSLEAWVRDLETVVDTVGLDDSCNHLLPERDPAWPRFLAALDDFLAPDRARTDPSGRDDGRPR
jgi:hypothetical protein